MLEDLRGTSRHLVTAWRYITAKSVQLEDLMTEKCELQVIKLHALHYGMNKMGDRSGYRSRL